MPPPPKGLTALLRRFDPAIRDLTTRLRAVVLREMGPCRETIYDAGYTVALWYGFTDRVLEGCCFIAVYTKHVNLAFYRGSLLPDPHRLLQGTGKWMRHIQVKTSADVERPELRDYVRLAMAQDDDDRMPGEKRPRLKDVVSTVKVIDRKRPPGAPKAGRSARAR
jgi:hypothetical protein